MSFLNNLGKGFIRSVVNQVGRDGGKVISNNIYGDKHSTSIKNTNIGTQNFSSENNTDIIDRAELLKQGFKKEFLSSSILENIFLGIGSFVLPIIGTIYWLIIGFKNLFKTKTQFYIYQQQAVYKSDKRYSTGSRLNGYKNVKAYAPKTVEATKSERIIYIIKGFISLVLAYSTFMFWHEIYTNWNSNEEINVEIQEEKNIGITMRFTDLYKEPSKESEKIESIYTTDTITLLNETKTDIDSVTTWYKVKYNDNSGWVYNKKKKLNKQ